MNASHPPADLAALLDRDDLVTWRVRRRPATVVKLLVLLTIAGAASIFGVAAWPWLVELGAGGASARGRGVALVPFFLSAFALIAAVPSGVRVWRGEFAFSFVPTREPMIEHHAFCVAVGPAREPVDEVARLERAFATGDPRAYAPLPSGPAPGWVTGRILVAFESRVAIATAGVRRGGVTIAAQPVVLRDDAFAALLATSKRELRTGRFSAARGRELDASVGDGPA